MMHSRPWAPILLSILRCKRLFSCLQSYCAHHRCRIGPSEFDISGSLRTWSVLDKLQNIRVSTLVINGKDDEAQNVCVEPFEALIPRGFVTRREFLDSSHMPFWEEQEAYLEVVSDFLKK